MTILFFISLELRIQITLCDSKERAVTTVIDGMVFHLKIALFICFSLPADIKIFASMFYSDLDLRLIPNKKNWHIRIIFLSVSDLGFDAVALIILSVDMTSSNTQSQGRMNKL